MRQGIWCRPLFWTPLMSIDFWDERTRGRRNNKVGKVVGLGKVGVIEGALVSGSANYNSPPGCGACRFVSVVTPVHHSALDLDARQTPNSGKVQMGRTLFASDSPVSISEDQDRELQESSLTYRRRLSTIWHLSATSAWGRSQLVRCVRS